MFDESAVEYSTDISAIATVVNASEFHIVDGFYMSSGQAQQGTEFRQELINLNNHSFISQNAASNNSQLFVVYAQALNGTSNVFSHLSWIELD